MVGRSRAPAAAPPSRAGLPDADTLRALRQQARRLSRSDADAQDLVQEVLLAALQAGRADPAWLTGVLRRQAAMAIRSAVRRRRRERSAAEAPAPPTPAVWDAAGAERAAALLLARLPPASRRVAVLALHGLDAAEIRWLLAIPAGAFRQRVAVIRRAIAALAPEARLAVRSLADPPATGGRLRSGRLRRLLKAAMRDAEAVGTHDPDGHLLLLTGSAHVLPLAGNG